jgi:ABC-type uncharacterized transport system permease subunit
VCSRLLLLFTDIAFRWEERNTLKILSALSLLDVIWVAGTVTVLKGEAFASETCNLAYLWLFVYARRFLLNMQLFPYSKNQQDALIYF